MYSTLIQVDFTNFAMESHPNCFYDYVEIFNGPYASSPSIGRFCGNTPPTGFRSQSNTIRVVLFTDYSQAAAGFRMTYAFTTQGILLTEVSPLLFTRQVTGLHYIFKILFYFIFVL